MFLAVYVGGFRPRCKATSRMQSPVAWLVVWEVGCLGDQVSPVPNNFHQTRARDLALCKGFLTNDIPLTQVVRHSSHPDHNACPHRMERDTKVR